MLRPVFQIEVPSIGRIFRLVPRPHWQRRTRLSDKGSDCVRYLCPTFELPVAGAAALFCTANASPLHTNNCARHSWQRQRREHLHWCKLKKNYVRTCILCIGTLARILGALQSLHKAGIATFSWISKHQKQPTLSPFVFLISYALHTRVLHSFRCMYLHLCFPLKLLHLFDKHVFAAVPQISVFHSPNFRSAFFMQPIPPSSKIHQCFVLFVFFASNFLLIRLLHGSLHQLVLSRDCKEIIMWKTKLDKDYHITECLTRIII